MPGKTRTLSLQIRSLTLYPIELQARKRKKGLEPSTLALARLHSAN